MIFCKVKSETLEHKIGRLANQKEKDKSKSAVKGLRYLFLIMLLIAIFLEVGFTATLAALCIFCIFSGAKARRHFYMQQKEENEQNEKGMLQLKMKYEKRIRDIPYILMSIMLIFIAIFLAFSLWNRDILFFILETDLGKLLLFLVGLAFLICETMIANIYIILDKEE